MYVSGTSDIRVGRNNIGFYLRLNLVKGIVGGNAEDFGEVRSWEEGLVVVYCGDTRGGEGRAIIRYIANR